MYTPFIIARTELSYIYTHTYMNESTSLIACHQASSTKFLWLSIHYVYYSLALEQTTFAMFR
jgi:hypothetical protein